MAADMDMCMCENTIYYYYNWFKQPQMLIKWQK